MFCPVFSAWVVFGWLGALLLRGGGVLHLELQDPARPLAGPWEAGP